ncbi:hypothetical protein [Neobacillus soli]|uniref:hypothetical protein n=1 Tax=Neobacillus soli TaxID=220688 RepID=UPI000AFD9537|nr:hypothetical protein [Neobacillus soli]
MLPEDLIDNEATTAEALWFDMEDEKKGTGFRFTFRKTDKTEGFGEELIRSDLTLP